MAYCASSSIYPLSQVSRQTYCSKWNVRRNVQGSLHTKHAEWQQIPLRIVLETRKPILKLVNTSGEGKMLILRETLHNPLSFVIKA